MQEELAAAYKRIEEWEKQKMPPAAFVKVTVEKGARGAKEATPEGRSQAESCPAPGKANAHHGAPHQHL
jgi:hypothetical protein